MTNWKTTIIGVACVAMFAALPAKADKLEDVLNLEAQNNQVLAQQQDRVDNLQDQTDDLVNEYRDVTAQVESLKVYNKQLEDLITAQEAEIASLERQIDYVTLVERQIMPLIQRMIDGLDEFVELDVPFRIEERRDRVARLQALMDNANVSTSERFRQVLSAYEIETEFGRTVDTYTGTMTVDGTEKTVNFVNVGRIAFMYQTRDRETSALWNPETKAWEKLPASYNLRIDQIIQMAQGNVQSDVIRLPVFAPEEVSQ